MFTIYEHFRDFVKCISRFCCKISMKIIFYVPVNTDKPKFVVFFLVFVCTNASFNAQISSSKNASKRDAIYRLRNSQALFRVTDVIRKTCKLVFTDLVNTKRCQHKNTVEANSNNFKIGFQERCSPFSYFYPGIIIS